MDDDTGVRREGYILRSLVISVPHQISGLIWLRIGTSGGHL
jgi:hypothetical protein